MSKWYERHPVLLERESRQLSRNGNYQQLFQYRDKLFASTGNILIRLNGETIPFSVAIVYPEATPYLLPQVYMLRQALSGEELRQLVGLIPSEVTKFLEAVLKPN
jgi:hypothetical protein